MGSEAIGKRYKTLADAAIGLDRSTQQLGTYVKRGMPRNEDGSVDHDKAVAWISDNVKNTKEERSAKREKAASETDWEAVKLQEEARTKRLKRRQLQGRLIQRKEVEQALAELVIRVRTRLEQVPDEMEMEFPLETRAENKRSVKNKIDNILREMSQWEL